MENGIRKSYEGKTILHLHHFKYVIDRQVYSIHFYGLAKPSVKQVLINSDTGIEFTRQDVLDLVSLLEANRYLEGLEKAKNKENVLKS